MAVSKVLLCSDRPLVYEAEMVVRGLHVPLVTTMSSNKLDGLLLSCPDEHKLVAHVVSTMDRLSIALRHVMECGGLLLAYDMPILDAFEDVQRYLPLEMEFHERDKEAVDMCCEMLRNMYMAVGFEYVFRFSDGPPRDVLVENGIVCSGGGVVSVSSWTDVVQVLTVEGA